MRKFKNAFISLFTYGVMTNNKRFISILLAAVLSIVLFSCSGQKESTEESWSPDDWAFAETVAREVTDDGWVYTFSFQYSKQGTIMQSTIPFTFTGVNLRYRYNDNYYTVTTDSDGVEHKELIPVLLLGTSDSEAVKRDMQYIHKLIAYDGETVTKESLLALGPEDIELEEIDEEMFLRLMHEALTGEPHEYGQNGDLPIYAMLTSPEYIDGYKFQIGFTDVVGCVDVIFIDVLYESEEGKYGYVQLSDLIDANTATPEQIELYNTIQEISKGIVENNELMYGFEENGDKIIDDVKFSELYIFLKDISEKKLSKYVIFY